MKTNSTNINIRMDRALKEQADGMLAEFGMNMTTAFNIFLRQMVRQGKIPFEIALNKPNEETLAAIREIEGMRNGSIPKKSMSVADFVREMGD